MRYYFYFRNKSWAQAYVSSLPTNIVTCLRRTLGAEWEVMVKNKSLTSFSQIEKLIMQQQPPGLRENMCQNWTNCKK